MLLAQLGLEHLPAGVARQRIDERETARALVAGEVLAAVLLDLCGGRRVGGVGGTTTASGVSPHFWSGTPMTATSATLGCAARAFSTSAQ